MGVSLDPPPPRPMDIHILPFEQGAACALQLTWEVSIAPSGMRASIALPTVQALPSVPTGRLCKSE
jgi:hypothetical protein